MCAQRLPVNSSHGQLVTRSCHHFVNSSQVKSSVTFSSESTHHNAIIHDGQCHTVVVVVLDPFFFRTLLWSRAAASGAHPYSCTIFFRCVLRCIALCIFAAYSSKIIQYSALVVRSGYTGNVVVLPVRVVCTKW